jgi:hypothetical protein
MTLCQHSRRQASWGSPDSVFKSPATARSGPRPPRPVMPWIHARVQTFTFPGSTGPGDLISLGDFPRTKRTVKMHRMIRSNSRTPNSRCLASSSPCRRPALRSAAGRTIARGWFASHGSRNSGRHAGGEAANRIHRFDTPAVRDRRTPQERRPPARRRRMGSPQSYPSARLRPGIAPTPIGMTSISCC